VAVVQPSYLQPRSDEGNRLGHTVGFLMNVEPVHARSEKNVGWSGQRCPNLATVVDREQGGAEHKPRLEG
jgi:hypothetical protein